MTKNFKGLISIWLTVAMLFSLTLTPVQTGAAGDGGIGLVGTEAYSLINSAAHEHPVCGESCSHTTDGHSNLTWTPVSTKSELKTAVSSDGNYYLANDIDINSGAESSKITVEANVNLCLNGHLITNTDTDRIFEIAAGKTLTITDCMNTEHVGSLGTDGNWIDEPAASSDANVSIYGGGLYGATAGTVYINDGATFNMYGGNITGNKGSEAIANSGIINIYDGKITDNSCDYAIDNWNGILNMYGGEIKGIVKLNQGAYISVEAPLVNETPIPIVLSSITGVFAKPGGSIQSLEAYKDKFTPYEDLYIVSRGNNLALIGEHITQQPNAGNNYTVIASGEENEKIYEWYKLGETKTYTVTSDASSATTIQANPDYYSGYTEGKWWCSMESGGYATYFNSAELKMGDVVTVTLDDASTTEGVELNDYGTGSLVQSNNDAKTKTSYTFEIIEDGSYEARIKLVENISPSLDSVIIPEITVTVDRTPMTLLDAQTANVFNTDGAESGRYRCVILYETAGITSGTKLLSDIFNYTSGTSGLSGGGTSRYSVVFNSNGGSGVAKAVVTRNAKLEKPQDPTKEGYTFDGWYTSSTLVTPYNFDAPVTQSFTLFAKWTADQALPSDGDGGHGVNCPSAKFPDIDTSNWYHQATDFVIEKGYMKGYENGLFGINDKLTRAQFVTILWNVEGKPQVNYIIPFDDVDENAYTEAIRWAASEKIVLGVSDTKFEPDSHISREQLAVILYRYASYKGYDVSVGENTNILSYDDFDEISEYAISAMQYAVGAGIIEGDSETTLNPQGHTTRAQAAAIIKRFVEYNK